jgi:acyl-CoA thioester hydrolase
MGHMNVMWYAGKFDEATWHLLSQIGITASYLHANRRYMAAVHQETTYKRELFAGDLITIRSRILEIHEKVVRMYHEMLDSEKDEIAATTTLTGVHLASLTRKACPFPADSRAWSPHDFPGHSNHRCGVVDAHTTRLNADS